MIALLAAGMFGGAVAVLAHSLLTAPRVMAGARRTRRQVLDRWRGSLGEAVELLGTNELRVASAQAAAALVLGVVAVAAFRPALWPVLLPAALVIGYNVPLGVVQRRVADYRGAIRSDLADAVDFIDLHLVAGYNVPQALAGTSDLTAGPLRRELKRVLAHVAAGEPPGEALREFSRRAGDVDVTTVARHVASAWTMAAPGQEVFTGLTDTLRRLAEAQVVARTRKLPTLFSLLVGLGLVNLLLLAGAPTLAWLLHTLAQTS